MCRPWCENRRRGRSSAVCGAQATGRVRVYVFTSCAGLGSCEFTSCAGLGSSFTASRAMLFAMREDNVGCPRDGRAEPAHRFARWGASSSVRCESQTIYNLSIAPRRATFACALGTRPRREIHSACPGLPAALARFARAAYFRSADLAASRAALASNAAS